MSEVAGRIATQAGAYMLHKPLGGRGILLGGVPGVAGAKVLVIGGGAVGYEFDGITRYCVDNMPGAVPVTST